MKDDGGSAFPVAEGAMHSHSIGMSLRDWFAGQALPSMLAATVAANGWGFNHESVTEECYKVADAMINARAL